MRGRYLLGQTAYATPPGLTVSGVGGAAVAWLEADDLPRAIVDEQLAILWANSGARSLLAEKTEIEERGGCLAAADPLYHLRLVQVVRPRDEGLLSCCIPLEAGNGHLLIRGLPLAGYGPGIHGLQMVRTDRPGSAAYRDLDTAFGLTPTEHRVLLSLLSGKEADRLTQEMGVSIETIRSHIRSFYAKIEVNSREQLFAKAQPFRV